MFFKRKHPVDHRLDHQKMLHNLDPFSAAGEAFRTLKTNLRFMNVDQQVKVIGVTSPGEGNGKSLISANLSISMAENNHRVLLLDGDLRKPRVHSLFDVPGSVGLVTALLGQAEVDDLVFDSDLPGLHIMSAGAVPPNPVELLSSKHMERVLDELRETYDTIIVDMAPVLPVVDTTILSRLCDGVILTIVAGETDYRLGQAAKRDLQNAGAHLLGVALNRIEFKEQPYYDRYGSSYGYGYGYGADAARQAAPARD